MATNLATEPIWKDIVTGKVTVEFEFMAARILQAAVSRSFKQSPSEIRLEHCAQDLRELFMQNMKLSAVKKDLTRILGSKF